MPHHPDLPFAPPDRQIVFLHMPKVGGRSVGQLLRRAFPTDICPYKRWADIVEHRGELAGHRVFRGHLYEAITDFLTPGAVTISFFREPVSRVISEYRFICRTPEHGRHELVRRQSLEEFVSRPSNLASYSRFLGHRPAGGDYMSMRQTVPDDELLAASKARIDEMGFVGLTESFTDHFRALERWFGIQPADEIPRVNVDPAQRTQPDPEVAALIRQVGWIECEIYEHARKVIAERSVTDTHSAGRPSG